jgi:hypothetical protein
MCRTLILSPTLSLQWYFRKTSCDHQFNLYLQHRFSRFGFVLCGSSPIGDVFHLPRRHHNAKARSKSPEAYTKLTARALNNNS